MIETYVIRMYPYVSVCYSYVYVCMCVLLYIYVTRMLPVCTRMLLVVPVCSLCHDPQLIVKAMLAQLRKLQFFKAVESCTGGLGHLRCQLVKPLGHIVSI